MTEALKKFEAMQVPPHVARKLKLGTDWKKSVTRDFATKVLEAADKHRDALRKLEQY